MRISIEQPLILLLIPCGILLLVFSMRFLRNRCRDQKIKQVILRSIVWSLLCLALSGVRFYEKGTSVATVFIVDASDSVKDKRNEITQFIQDAVKTKSSDDLVGIVTVGKDPTIENFISDACSFNGIQTTVDSSATDLQAAVNLALAIMPESSAKRIVIISDGAENIGSLKDTVPDVTMAGCDIKTYTLSESTQPEVCVKNVSIPNKVGTGEMFKVTVEVESNVQTEATVSLYQGRRLTGQKTINLSKGTSIIPFYDTQTDSGLKTYKVTIVPKKDTFSVNNEFSAFTDITDKNPVLLVYDKQDDAIALNNMLTGLGIDTRTVASNNLPDNLSGMLEYSCIIFCNVYASYLPEGFMNNLETYVKDYGKGFITCGGRNSYGLGRYQDTVIEKILPVSMEPEGESEIPATAIMFVIDHSGSMMDAAGGGATKLDAAKRAVQEAIDPLRPIDMVGVMAFDTEIMRVVPLAEVGDSVKSIKNAVSMIPNGGGTSIYPAVVAAADDIIKSPASIRHIILLTDGQDYYDSYGSIIQRLNDNYVTLSTIAMGQDCNYQLLNNLSTAAGGRMYNVTDASELPKIFTQEVFLTANTYLVDEITPSYITSSDDVIREFAAGGFPEIKAYVATTIKERATELLATEQDDPLLAYWQYGLGKTVAWTSDISGNWSGDYFAWENNALLWNNLIQLVTKDNSAKDSYVDITQASSVATIAYHTDNFTSKTEVKAVITSDTGETSEISLKSRTPGDFTADFEMIDEGAYSVAVKQYENGELISGINTAAIKKYSMEYAFNRSTNLLSDYATLTGGSEVTSPAQIFTKNIRFVKTMKDATVPVILIALLLFVLDIAYRRFRFRIVPEGFWNGLINKIIKKPVKEQKTPLESIAVPSPEDSKANTPKPSKVVRKPSEKKQNKPDVLDTSQLLNRMKK